MGRKTLITAAGGNGTAIDIIEEPLSRSEYEQQGKALGELMEQDGAEQAGFLVKDTSHFEMAGGEFCGNASRAAAVLFSEAWDKNDLTFTVSGFDGQVHAVVQKENEHTYQVRCEFPGMPTEATKTTRSNGQPVQIVDLGGIVHVVIEASFPNEREQFEQEHREIMQEFSLGDREAVGVVWFTRTDDAIVMDPVVWVNAVDTFFHETSCGSGTIAVGKVTGARSIVQPSGKTISAEITEGGVVLESEMEVVL